MKEGGCSRSPARPRAGLMLLLLLSCSPSCWRGVDWRGVGCVRDGDVLHDHALLVAVAAISPFPFLCTRSVAQVQLGEGGVLAAPTLAAEGRVGEVRWRCANAGE